MRCWMVLSVLFVGCGDSAGAPPDSGATDDGVDVGVDVGLDASWDVGLDASMDASAVDASMDAAFIDVSVADANDLGADEGPSDPCPEGTNLNFVAHTDDDLLFLNPDIANDILSGRCVRTVYFTAGDNNQGPTYWGAREDGVESAYATMAGVVNDWTSMDAGIPGKAAVLRTLSARPSVSLVFLRLPDGQGDGAGSSNNAFQSLRKLHQGTIGSIDTVDDEARYTKTELTRAVAHLIASFAPDTVRTQNLNGFYGDGDHSDHLAASFFVNDASVQATVPYMLIAYADYVISTYPSNVAGADLAIKTAAWNAYALFDPLTCGSPPACNGNLYDQWLSRRYTTGTIQVGADAE